MRRLLLASAVLVALLVSALAVHRASAGNRTKGTADHWSPLEQIWTAERAVHTSGFWPWPNTARICGLI